MRTRRFTKDDVETRWGGYDKYDSRPLNHPAVNVKVYKSMRELNWSDLLKDLGESADSPFTLEWIENTLSDNDINDWFYATCESEWEMLEQDATEILGSVTVEQEGRSGGWAVVKGLPDVESWDAVMVSKWGKFAKYARQIADGIPYQMASMIYLNAYERLVTSGAPYGWWV